MDTLNILLQKLILIKINKLTFPPIITKRILEDDIVFHNQTIKVMKQVGVLNLINQLIVVVLCGVVIFDVIDHTTIGGFIIVIPTMLLLFWELTVIANTLADLVPIRKKYTFLVMKDYCATEIIAYANSDKEAMDKARKACQDNNWDVVEVIDSEGHSLIRYY